MKLTKLELWCYVRLARDIWISLKARIRNIMHKHDRWAYLRWPCYWQINEKRLKGYFDFRHFLFALIPFPQLLDTRGDCKWEWSVSLWREGEGIDDYICIVWEQIYNPEFKVFESEHFKKQAGLLTFTPSVSEWINQTNAIGL